MANQGNLARSGLFGTGEGRPGFRITKYEWQGSSERQLQNTTLAIIKLPTVANANSCLPPPGGKKPNPNNPPLPPSPSSRSPAIVYNEKERVISYITLSGSLRYK